MTEDQAHSTDDRTAGDRELERLESRRRLLKAGLVAVPFLVTLHALPARAQARGQGSLGTYGYVGGENGGAAGAGGDAKRTGGTQQVGQSED